MSAPNFTPPLFDEEVMLFLGGRKAGDPIPANVITEVNPFSLEPWDSPEPFGNRTAWMMHEYYRDQKACYASNFSQDYESMCRVFLQNDQSSKFCDFNLPGEEQHSPFNSYDDDDDAEHIESMLMRFLEDERSSSSTDAPNRSQPFIGSEQVVQAVAGSEQVEKRPPTLVNTSFQYLNSSSASDPHAYLGISMDEYLELNDLYDPDSASSSSNNSSLMSIYSDEYFNSEELLRYLGSASSQNMQEEYKDYKFYVSTSANPVNLVVKPAQPAGLIACHNSHQVGEEYVLAEKVHSQGNSSKPCSSAYDSCIQSHPKRTHSRSSESSSSSYGS